MFLAAVLSNLGGMVPWTARRSIHTSRTPQVDHGNKLMIDKFLSHPTPGLCSFPPHCHLLATARRMPLEVVPET